jgi:predicted CXXCH cytochrome family protein
VDRNQYELQKLSRSTRMTLVLAGACCLASIFNVTVEVLASAPPPPKTDQCVECHQALDGELAAPKLEGDVHVKVGLSCSSCHGGDPHEPDAETAMSSARGFLGRPTAVQISSFCGKCHSDASFMRRYNPSQRVDQEVEYSASQHGKRLRQGNGKVATCVSCHGGHGIREVNHPLSPVYPTRVAATCGKCHGDAGYMGSAVASGQIEDYNASVHADALMKKNDLSAPTCNDCHGNHGAAPPGVSSVANVCGTCHTRQADLFRKSPHHDAFEGMGLAECLACHENHKVVSPTDHLVGVQEGSTCISCHSEGDPGYSAAGSMSQSIVGLVGLIDQADGILRRAERAGMEVSRARFTLSEAHDSLINARVLVHAFSVDQLRHETDQGGSVAAIAFQAGEKALQEIDFRRKGLAASLLVIALAIVAIYLKLQDIERPGE